MLKIKKHFLVFLLCLLAIFIFIVSVWTILYFESFAVPDFQLGVNFSKSYSEYLGLDWQKTYLALLDDLKIKNVRLSAPWNEIQPNQNQWDFSAVDWQVRQAQQRGVNVVLVVGRRAPHWPECHDPTWLHGSPGSLVQEYQLKMVQAVVERYKGYKNIVLWQVENEPLVSVFGQCPEPDLNFLRKEIALVKTLDDRPVLITDSGELGLWFSANKVADVFGTTLYRVTHNDSIGYFYYHLPPLAYYLKAWLTGHSAHNIFVMELQAEPWAAAGLLNTSLEEQALSMDAERLTDNVRYAERAGFAGAYLWGGEWWYWMKTKQADSSLWEAARTLFQQ